ncbi:hypothetical protein [Nostoc sp. FACHB-110]|uniref:hypothetical protein n=1 Tax=Nostoc sp. FACHB-110 TaxID=2692834 RepID=UPI001688DAF8|nr:hypothetical protein [Nostoc sp. FACHB-110]MBD2437074.1 hypothetical protein [Nostoc sp. FACHB-110]
MINKTHNSENITHLTSQVELELLEALLEPEDATYPWNPADDEAETYFVEMERQFVMQDLLEEELHTRADSFYGKLDSLWSEVTNCSYYKCNTRSSILTGLQETLHTAFAAKIPHGWLDAIAQKATEIFASQQSMGEQLVECVQAVLPGWETDDLAVFARPYAYAMRSSEPQNLTAIINNVASKDWASLSEIEQAKLSVAIAYYAIKQLDNSQTEA